MISAFGPNPRVDTPIGNLLCCGVYKGAKGGLWWWNLHADLFLVKVGHLQAKSLRSELSSVSWKLRLP